MAFGNISGYQGGANCSNLERVEGSDGQVYLKIYNNTGSALANGAIKTLAFLIDATDTANPIIKGVVVAPATATNSIVVVVDNGELGAASIVDKDYGFVCVQGYCQALCNGGTAIAAGDQLKVANGGTAFIQSVSGNGSAIAVATCAIAFEAYATGTDALKKVYLINKPSTIA